ncbi:MAG: sigma-54 dependent transcriptional regulator [Rhodothermaceae bacterium]|nr:sigma-54 dependent transcriptional regulator [Rhodothermaceae bacterium]
MDRASVQERFGIVGTSAALNHVIDQMRLVARTDVNVLVYGESGVGKEVVAKAIHEMSARRHKSLIIVNCGAIPEGLIESELFGAEKGAYTGATERRSGHFEEADGGSIFLDEIGEMPLAAQVRLLRVLETGEYSRVGSSKVMKSDTRVIAATNKKLGNEVQGGRFREDLYYRLSTVEINIPPLRERAEDILPILDSFLYEFSQRYESPIKRLSPEARQMLRTYRWPGNVRELRNLAEQLVVLVPKQDLGVDDIRPYLRGVTASGSTNEIVLASNAKTSWRDSGPDGEVASKELQLIYRALLELRLEMKEIKQHLSGPAPIPHRSEPRTTVQEDEFPPERPSFIIESVEPNQPLLPAFEEFSYEIESSNDTTYSNDHSFEEEDTDANPFPTLEDAEQELITKALKHYKGNRRQTARALGISERTLYRKLKELDEEL